MTRIHDSIFLILPLLISVGACATIQSQWQHSASRRILTDTSKYTPDIQLLYQTLETAYTSESLPLLDRFLEAWYRDPDLQPSSSTLHLSDTIKAVYDVFHVFGDSLYRTTLPFVILPTSVTYSLDDSVEAETYRNDSAFISSHGHRVLRAPLLANRKLPSYYIRDFRPLYRSGKSRILYLGKAYDRALHLFLRPPETESAESYKPFAIEAEKRAEFLRNRISVLKGHNGYYFFFELPPMFDRVCLSKDLNYAEVSHSYGDFYGSTDAFIKTNGQWSLFHSFHDVWHQ